VPSKILKLSSQKYFAPFFMIQFLFLIKTHFPKSDKEYIRLSNEYYELEKKARYA